ncbi:hypothetical protein BDN72DRAFT_879396 [Pluteus cervinus]|uniref:Uncharacterized protein n=1 Tax=Pluteus cervinus TaxID=181527 RepID=A0ACD3APD1_9AGAR|nr:hypothetical protein BDN72DRAFT_879396 [Pluteus cervinus]
MPCEIPEIVWFKPTQTHIDNPAQHILTSVPEAKTAVSNLWYSAYGEKFEERVMIVNWKSKELQKSFMATPAYVSWGMPLIELTSTAAVVGQYHLPPPSSDLVLSIFRSPLTEFLYFETEIFNDTIGEYMNVLQGIGSCVGCVWGECVEEWNPYKGVLIVGWNADAPVHNTQAERLYRYLVANCAKRWSKKLSYIPI